MVEWMLIQRGLDQMGFFAYSNLLVEVHSDPNFGSFCKKKKLCSSWRVKMVPATKLHLENRSSWNFLSFPMSFPMVLFPQDPKIPCRDLPDRWNPVARLSLRRRLLGSQLPRWSTNLAVSLHPLHCRRDFSGLWIETFLWVFSDKKMV